MSFSRQVHNSPARCLGLSAQMIAEIPGGEYTNVRSSQRRLTQLILVRIELAMRYLYVKVWASTRKLVNHKAQTKNLLTDADSSTNTKTDTKGRKLFWAVVLIFLFNFHRIGPLGRFDLLVAKSVCPFSCTRFWGLFCPHFPKLDVQNF